MSSFTEYFIRRNGEIIPIYTLNVYDYDFDAEDNRIVIYKHTDGEFRQAIIRHSDGSPL
jgi:hypothetical protein